MVAVSGPLGAAMAGYHQLENGLRIDAESIDLFLRPQPRIGAGVEACDARATAMMDISDGLVTDLARLALASGVGVAIESARVPIHPSVGRVAGQVVANPVDWALTGGEDHHLVATFSARAELPAGWAVIGVVTRGREGLEVDGKAPTLWGWDHFPRALG